MARNVAHLAHTLAADIGAAQSAFRAGRFAEASAGFEACARNGAGPEAWLNAGASAARANRAGDAMRLYRVACEVLIDDVRAWDGLARSAAYAGDADATIAALEHLVRIDGSSEQWLRLAVSYRNRDRHREARYAYAMLLLREPHYLIARFEAMQAIPLPQRDEAEVGRLARDWLRDLEYFESIPDGDPHLVAHREALLHAATNFHFHALPICTVDVQRRYAELIARWARAELGA